MADTLAHADTYRSLVEAAADPMMTLDASGRFLYANPATAALHGMQRDDLIGKSLADLFPPDVVARYLERIRSVIATGRTMVLEERADLPGKTFWFSTVMQPLRDDGGRIIAVQAVVRDITRLHQADEALRASNQRLRQAVHVAHIGIFEHDHVTNSVYMSPELREIYGLGAASAEGDARSDGRSFMDCVHPHDRAMVAAAMARAHDPSGDGIYDIESRLVRPDGVVRVLHTRAQTFYEGQGRSRRPIRTVGAVRDITALRAAEHARRTGDERLRQAVGVAHIGIFEHDHRTNHLYLSPEQRRINGIPPDVDVVLGRAVEPGENATTFNLLIHPDDIGQVMDAMQRSHDPAGDGGYDVEHRFTASDGTTRWVRTLAQTFFEGEGAQRRPVRTVGASRDITDDKHAEAERLALQAQLGEAQKMESVGRFAGGVAHDFNNMLNVILGWGGIALEDLPPDDALQQPLREINTAAERAAALTRQLLAFARRQPATPKVVDLNDAVERSLEMVAQVLGPSIHLAWSPGQSLWPVRIDPVQLDQIIATLVPNARDAINGAGQVAISTENVTIARESAVQGARLAPGDYVVLRVADTGSGMDSEMQQHVFEPFYTTHSTGKRIGLGLASVYGIVRQNNGVTQVESALGQGTTISIFLPRVVGPRLVTSQGDAAAAAGREVVLLVEDEPMMLDLGRTMLERLGYHVIAAASPSDAITLAARHAGEIDLLFTDVVMPSMSGVDLAAYLMAKYDGLKCLFASGHFADGDTGGLEDGFHFVHKPFSLAELAAKVRAALDDLE